MKKNHTLSEIKVLIKNSSLKYLETFYINAKINYYEGSPIMDDATFDFLEKDLKSRKSKIIKQVGSKRKDFNVPHPTKMLSLAKEQMEIVEGVVDYKVPEFEKWVSKRLDSDYYLYSPKFDGNAINIVYEGQELSYVLTRGDGEKGKNITARVKNMLPRVVVYNKPQKTDILEVRCEVVIKKKDFEKINKERLDAGEELYANPRNYVAGLLGSDHEDVNLKYLKIKALAFILNGYHLDPLDFKEFKTSEYITKGTKSDYQKYIEFTEFTRNKYEYQIDGVVVAYPAEYREALGENDHDPEWAIAIKLLPEEVHAKIEGVEWNVGKTGELAPVLLIEPVELAGTTVKRISGYNAGFITENALGKGAKITVHKAGDIIPELVKVLEKGSKPKLPTNCPVCGEVLDLEDIHLVCTNDICPGKMKKRFHSAAKLLDIKGVGPAVFEKFAGDFITMADLITWVRTKGETKEIEKFGFTHGSRSHEIFVNAFNKIDQLTYGQIIVLLGYSNVGLKMADQVAREQCGLEPDYSGHDRSLIAELNTKKSKIAIEEAINKLEDSGIEIIYPTDEVEEESGDNIYVVMTGKTTPNWKTKKEFISDFSNVVDVEKLTDERVDYLLTNDLSSTSSKMTKAKKDKIPIITYNDFYNKYSK